MSSDNDDETGTEKRTGKKRALSSNAQTPNSKKRPAPKVGRGHQVLSKYFGGPKEPSKTAIVPNKSASTKLPNLKKDQDTNLKKDQGTNLKQEPGTVKPRENDKQVLSLVSDSESEPDTVEAKGGSSRTPTRQLADRPPQIRKADADQATTLAERLAAIDALEGDSGDDVDDDEDNDDDTNADPKTVKLTPLEKQWKDLKDEYPDVLLCVECGYKYRLFDNDAKIAAQVLSIAVFPKRAFLTASFPVHRLHVHVRRLVEAGHLVGIVTQTETAALKKQSATKSKIFTRELTALYSRATLLPDAMLDVDPQPAAAAAASAKSDAGAARTSLFRGGWIRKRASSSAQKSEPPTENEDEDQDVLGNEDTQTSVDTTSQLTVDDFAEDEAEERFIIAVWELDADAKAPVLDLEQGWALGEPLPEAAKVTLGVFAVDVQSGTLVCDSFLDDSARTRLCELLERFDAYEYVLAGPAMSRATEEAILRKAQPALRRRRIDRVGFANLDVDAELNKLYGSNEVMLAKAKALDPVAQSALASLSRYLEPFKLQRVLQDIAPSLAGPAREQARMQLDPSALHDLEIVPGKAGPKYSLTYFVTRHALTPMGSRLLKQWVMQPLANVQEIRARQSAVATLSHSSNKFNSLMLALRQLKRFDLERGLEQVVHARCNPSTFLRLVDHARELAKTVAALDCDVENPLLMQILRDAEAGRLRDALSTLLRGLNRKSCESNTIGEMFEDRAAYPRIFEIKAEIDSLDQGFRQELVRAREVLKRPALQYRTLRTGISACLEYLIELPKAEAVPRDWNEVSSTQRVSRYTTPRVEDLLDQLARRREELAAAAKATWRQLLEDFADQHRARLRGLARAIAHIDAFHGLSKVAQLPGFVCPVVEEAGPNGGAFIHALRARHPLLDSAAAASDSCVPNDISLGDAPDGTIDMARVILVTGPNMGGKSSFTRTAAVCVVLAQIGAHVPAETCRIGVFDAIRVRMGVREDPMQGMSTFMVEMRQAASIFNHATPRTLCILDELGRGTSTFDGAAIAVASLRYVCQTMHSPCLFITHYTQLGALLEEFPRSVLAAMHMAYHETDDHKLVFLYQATAGLASNSYGLHVAQLAGLPDCVLDAARRVKLEKARKSNER
ncbi:DNA mismatch repair protein Msh3 [Hondaea fermentalgiana]|uniref:DNA mismatch repair protein n=1 Tax=Hondaea fermentalgiana TaxID=2315210 RepID=A0A2R5H019_9STRA|nr:DNA mismatch repair protein Msh3 [Hondaea fermentalgiana]|eukprot:GBG34081.1 DNA mismatch repair protein Msh3 [Hondaea fermentalgiana]